MTETTETQLYLRAPPLDRADAAALLAAALGAGPVACVRITAGSGAAEDAARIEALRTLCHTRGVAAVIEAPDGTAPDLATKHGLDGVHIGARPQAISDARRRLGNDAVIGVFAGLSQHNAMTAAEAGADYVSLGPTGGPGETVDRGLLDWWASTVETPLVVEGGLTPESAAALAGIADFIFAGHDLWESCDPAEAVRAWLRAIGG